MKPAISALPDGLSLRPELPSDAAFMADLYRDRRSDLSLIDAEPDFVDSLIGMQQAAQTQGYGTQFPNALYFVIEKSGEPVGRVCCDFGPNEVRLVDIALLTIVRGKGYGTAIVRALQAAAAQVQAPLSLSVAAEDAIAQRVYAGLGFRVEAAGPTHLNLIWYPEDAARQG